VIYPHTPITHIEGVTANRATLLASELGIKTCADLVSFFPFRYIDRTQFYTIKELEINQSEVQIVGKITHVKTVKQQRGSRLVATFSDATGTIELVWFKGMQWLKDSLKINEPYVVYGKTNHYKGRFSIPHPEMELVKNYKKKVQSAMQPVYPSTEMLNNKGISQKIMRTLLYNTLRQLNPQLQETLPASFLSTAAMLPKKTALYQVHFPETQALLAKASYRLKFEEFFYIQLQLLQQKQLRKSKLKGYPFAKVGGYFNSFYEESLPFELTGAQMRVLKEIRKDVSANTHMNRLLQGDVGSGKTIVALLSILLALDNGYQAAFMAPTEILAAQHYTALTTLLKETDINIALLTGSVPAKKRREIHAALEDGSLHILIGTHALLEDKVQFQNLGLAIIDEQHRFGVAQRSKLWKKNTLPPHILVMTATPIPRTLAMSVYGDLDISVIDELPPGRKDIQTVHRYDSNRLAVFQFLKSEIAKGRQVYVVYPLIKESETMDYKDLMDGYESIVREFPPDGPQKYQISIVHGKMKPADKAYEMARFVKGETQIMVATTVIEVGVNVPNASVMVIESAERFGLSQLHQLRGRVGRGADQSFCVLLTSVKLSSDAKTRLQTMVETSDGFKIAEVDLKLRGPGNIMGTQQSGVLQLKIADVVHDGDILQKARTMAIALLEEDPLLEKPENQVVLKAFIAIQKRTGLWSKIS